MTQRKIMKKQKFIRGQKVRVSDTMPLMMRHFTGGCDAIIIGSYSDLCHSSYQHKDDYEGQIDYSLLLLTDRPHSCSWYPENLLTFISADRDKGEDLIQKYKSE